MGVIAGYLLIFSALIGAGWVVIRTNALQKRGCGGGCGTCGNRNFCHRREERMKTAAQQKHTAQESSSRDSL